MTTPIASKRKCTPKVDPVKQVLKAIRQQKRKYLNSPKEQSCCSNKQYSSVYLNERKHRNTSTRCTHATHMEDQKEASWAPACTAYGEPANGKKTAAAENPQRLKLLRLKRPSRRTCSHRVRPIRPDDDDDLQSLRGPGARWHRELAWRSHNRHYRRSSWHRMHPYPAGRSSRRGENHFRRW